MVVLNLVGKRDPEADGVVDYCAYLGKEMTKLGHAVNTYRVPWRSKGWIRALFELFWTSPARHASLLMLHYTALQWSKRGVAGGFLVITLLARMLGRGVVVVLHDTDTYPGSGLIRKTRTLFQAIIMRWACRVSHAFLTTVPFEAIERGLRGMPHGYFVPVGPNLDTNGAENVLAEQGDLDEEDQGKVVGIYGVSGGSKFIEECKDIADVLRCTAALVPDVEVLLFGRGSVQAIKQLEILGLRETVSMRALGVIPADDVHTAMRACTVVLFVRGAISTRRGSAIAALACGRPIVAYESDETCGPILEAGILLSPIGDHDGICHDLSSVFTDRNLRVSLSKKSAEAYRRFFSWKVIGAQHDHVMRDVLRRHR